jgi:hypothetical protein
MNYQNIYQCDPWCIYLLNKVKNRKTYTLIVEYTIISHTFDVHKSLHSQKRTLHSYQVISLTMGSDRNRIGIKSKIKRWIWEKEW